MGTVSTERVGRRVAVGQLRHGMRFVFDDEHGGEGEIVTVDSQADFFGLVEVWTEELDFPLTFISGQMVTTVGDKVSAGALERAAARLDVAHEAERAARVETADAAVHLLCLHVRAERDDAATIVLEWSDQGDWLLVSQVLDFHGLVIDGEWDGADSIAANLGGDVETVWSTFMLPLADAPAIRRPTDSFRLPIDQTVRYFEEVRNA